MRKLRLLVTRDCNRACPLCCNNQFDIEEIPTHGEDYSGYDEIILTGGEPLFFPNDLYRAIDEIRRSNKTAPIYVYTAWRRGANIVELLRWVDGITLTLHNMEDLRQFKITDYLIHTAKAAEGKSLRLNITSPEVMAMPYSPLLPWASKFVAWVKDCPVPSDEVFFRWRDA